MHDYVLRDKEKWGPQLKMEPQPAEISRKISDTLDTLDDLAKEKNEEKIIKCIESNVNACLPCYICGSTAVTKIPNVPGRNESIGIWIGFQEKSLKKPDLKPKHYRFELAIWFNDPLNMDTCKQVYRMKNDTFRGGEELDRETYMIRRNNLVKKYENDLKNLQEKNKNTDKQKLQKLKEQLLQKFKTDSAKLVTGNTYEIRSLHDQRTKPQYKLFNLNSFISTCYYNVSRGRGLSPTTHYKRSAYILSNCQVETKCSNDQSVYTNLQDIIPKVLQELPVGFSNDRSIMVALATWFATAPLPERNPDLDPPPFFDNDKWKEWKEHKKDFFYIQTLTYRSQLLSRTVPLPVAPNKVDGRCINAEKELKRIRDQEAQEKLQKKLKLNQKSRMPDWTTEDVTKYPGYYAPANATCVKCAVKHSDEWTMPGELGFYHSLLGYICSKCWRDSPFDGKTSQPPCPMCITLEKTSCNHVR